MAHVSKGKMVKAFFKAIVILIIVGTVGLLFWRIFTSGDPSEVKALIANRTLADAQETADREGRTLEAFTQAQPTTITTATHNYNYFAVSRVVFIPEAEQLQLTFRYSNRTIKHVTEDQGLAEVPDRHEDLFDVTLWAVYDLTPDVTGDDENVEYVRFYPTDELTVETTKGTYNYRKYVFDGVDMTSTDKPLLTIYMDVYYVGEVDYEAEPYGTLPLYSYVYPNEAYVLSNAERRALKEFTDDP